MPINLDHIGLNTLIQEPVTASQNTIGHELTENVSSYTNTEVASITSGDYLATLNIHRNGPYGWPIFKQTRIGQNPLTRYQNRNSIFTYVTEIGDVKLLKQDGKLIDTIRERRSDLRQIIEAPVVSNYKPLTLIGSTEVESTRGGLLSKERIEIKATFANETTYFADDQTTREHGVDLETVEDYEDFVDLYLDGGLDSDDSPFDEFEMLRFDQTIFPAPGNMYLNQVRSREEFVNKFWRDNRSDRTQLNVDTGFGITMNSQSMWPLDTLSLHNDLFFTTMAAFPASTNSSSFDTVTYSGSLTSGNLKDYGILMNLYTIMNLGEAGLKPYQHFDEILSSAPLYSSPSISMLTSASINPHGIQKHSSFNNSFLSGNSGVLPGVFYGNSKWEAGIMSGKTPFYDSYLEYSEIIRSLGTSYSLVPEFKISDHVQDIISKGKESELYSNPLLSITGGTSNKNNISDQQFFKTYSNTDFLKNFEIIQQDNSGFVNPLSIKIKCKAIKKFLPYEDFYPCKKTVTLARTFHDTIKNNLNVNFTGSSAHESIPNVSDVNTELRTFPILEKLFSPGILYNTIKSGIAVDYPYSSEDWSISNYEFIFEPSGETFIRYNNDYFLKNQFDGRINFEALIEPDKYLSNKRFNHVAYDSLLISSGSWSGEGEITNYKLMINNFLAETNEFFLKNKNYTSIASIPEGDPNFGNCEVGKTYMMRIKMNRTLTGSKDPLTQNSQTFFPPQDNGNVRENFTLYSRPSAFGVPRMHTRTAPSVSEFTFSKWSKFKRSSIPSFSYHTGTYAFDASPSPVFEAIDGTNTFRTIVSPAHYKIGNNPAEGYNYPYTPPYYHGEAWADITFIATKQKHTLNEIINNCSTEFFRYYKEPEDYNTTSGGNYLSSASGTGDVYFPHYRLINEEAMQLPSSVNLFSKGILSDNPGITSNIGDQYRWIIQSKFETPHLNFNHIGYDDIELANWGPEATPIGMWHQYGVIPSASEGVFLQVTDVPPTFIDGPMGGDSSLTGSLADVCGFSTEPVKM